MYISILIIVK